MFSGGSSGYSVVWRGYRGLGELLGDGWRGYVQGGVTRRSHGGVVVRSSYW